MALIVWNRPTYFLFDPHNFGIQSRAGSNGVAGCIRPAGRQLIAGMIAGTETDEELYDFLKQYGYIQRIIPVDYAEPASGKQVIVEFVYGTAIQSLLPSLPHRLNSETQTDTTYHIRTLASVYTPVASKTATQTYLSVLKNIAKETGKDFAAVLREELSVISETVDLGHSEIQSEDIELA